MQHINTQASWLVMEPRTELGIKILTIASGDLIHYYFKFHMSLNMKHYQ